MGLHHSNYALLPRIAGRILTINLSGTNPWEAAFQQTSGENLIKIANPRRSVIPQQGPLHETDFSVSAPSRFISRKCWARCPQVRLAGGPHDHMFCRSGRDSNPQNSVVTVRQGGTSLLCIPIPPPPHFREVSPNCWPWVSGRDPTPHGLFARSGKASQEPTALKLVPIKHATCVRTSPLV